LRELLLWLRPERALESCRLWLKGLRLKGCKLLRSRIGEWASIVNKLLLRHTSLQRVLKSIWLLLVWLLHPIVLKAVWLLRNRLLLDWLLLDWLLLDRLLDGLLLHGLLLVWLLHPIVLEAGRLWHHIHVLHAILRVVETSVLLTHSQLLQTLTWRSNLRLESA
jgi:hypothetical protein